ncbi:MAG: 2-succinyl-5-enolpyruvyl-6-hydroxy-3-cyclohexene-1-carboxylic-acid synthase, partial [Bacillus sp. (in: firmicutes)]
MISYARTVCARAVAIAQSAPSGPVHLNFPFREPLIPKMDDELFQLNERPNGYIKVQNGDLTLSDEHFQEIAERLNKTNKGVIICGNIGDAEFPNAVTQLAEKLNFPIIADPLSQLRSGQHSLKNIIETYDTFLRNEDAKTFLKPEVVIRFGAMPISKALTIFLKENGDAEQFVIDGGAGWRDPSSLSTSMIFCDESVFCKKLLSYTNENPSSQFLTKWKKVNGLTKENMNALRDITELSEGKLFYQLADMVPEGATLFVGNSMPIRDLDSFFLTNNKEIKVMANRGANGIDGSVSSALGAALYSKSLYLVLG